MRKLTIGLMVMTVALTGCTQVRNEDVGTLLGGALGGLLGAQVGNGTGQLAAAAAGALFGSYLGGNVGRSMDDVDRIKTSEALETNATGETASWENPDTGAEYAVTPTKTYEADGEPCREFTTQATIDGEQEVVTGTACRREDGTWQVI